MSKIVIDYIAHKTPKKPNYILWRNTYAKYLHNLYCVFIESFNTYFDTDIKFDKEYNFEYFSLFIYESSSKYIVSDGCEPLPKFMKKTFRTKQLSHTTPIPVNTKSLKFEDTTNI
jgi:hypothetical protein